MPKHKEEHNQYKTQASKLRGLRIIITWNLLLLPTSIDWASYKYKLKIIKTIKNIQPHRQSRLKQSNYYKSNHMAT